MILDLRRNSLTIAEIYRKFFNWDYTAKRIISEMKSCKWFNTNQEEQMRRRKIKQEAFQRSIDKWLDLHKAW